MSYTMPRSSLGRRAQTRKPGVGAPWKAGSPNQKKNAKLQHLTVHDDAQETAQKTFKTNAPKNARKNVQESARESVRENDLENALQNAQKNVQNTLLKKNGGPPVFGPKLVLAA